MYTRIQPIKPAQYSGIGIGRILVGRLFEGMVDKLDGQSVFCFDLS